MAKLGVGIIGCGNISTTYLKYAPAFKALDLKAVADINMDSAKARAEEFGVQAMTVDELLASDEIQVVVNLTIPAAHFPITKRILESGKHAYSEKPLVLTLEEGEELRRIANEKGLRVGSAPDTFLGGAHQAAREAIDNGKTGKIVGGTCHFMGHGMEAWHPNPDFFFKPGGGPILDMGPYYITNLVQLIGPVKSVTAMTTAAFATRTIGNGPRDGEVITVETPTNIHALLEFHNGAVVTVGVSWDVWAHRHPNMDLYGELASLYVPDPNFFGGDVTLTDEKGEKHILDHKGHPWSVHNQENHLGEPISNYRCAGLADMVTAIEENRQHRCNIDLAVHVTEVMTSVLKAGAERTWVEMTTTCERPEYIGPDEAKAMMN